MTEEKNFIFSWYILPAKHPPPPFQITLFLINPLTPRPFESVIPKGIFIAMVSTDLLVRALCIQRKLGCLRHDSLLPSSALPACHCLGVFRLHKPRNGGRAKAFSHLPLSIPNKGLKALNSAPIFKTPPPLPLHHPASSQPPH